MESANAGLDVNLEELRRLSERKRAELSCEELQSRQETVTEMVGLLGKAHTLAILGHFAFDRGPYRFNELESALGISPNTLSERLSELVDAGLLTRHSYDEIPRASSTNPPRKRTTSRRSSATSTPGPASTIWNRPGTDPPFPSLRVREVAT